MARLGVTYEFPSTDDRHENKSAFQEMMAAFQAKHPDRGLILVIDELSTICALAQTKRSALIFLSFGSLVRSAKALASASSQACKKACSTIRAFSSSPTRSGV